jgi:hypothetical protein
MHKPVLKFATLGATIMVLAACSQQTPGQYSEFEGLPLDAPFTTSEIQAASTGNAGKGSETPTVAGTAPPIVSSPQPAPAPAGGIIARLNAIIATLNARAAAARATQPDWPTPVGQN